MLEKINDAILNSNVRHEFVIIMDVVNGNPNGDPDNDNAPRQDLLTHHGRVTPECLKRKHRNYIALTRKNESPYKIFVQERSVLNNLIKQGVAFAKQSNASDVTLSAQQYMCQNYVDLRFFGGILSTGTDRDETTKSRENAGQLTGAFQLADAVSVEPITPILDTVTRCAVTNEKDAHKERTMGRRWKVPYGCYIGHGVYYPSRGKVSGVTNNDMALFWEGVLRMFSQDQSSARGEMNLQKLIIFSHDNELGNCSPHKNYNRVRLEKKDPKAITRNFNQYNLIIDEKNLPQGVQVTALEY